MEGLRKRSEVPENEKWDLSRLYKNTDGYKKDLQKAMEISEEIVNFKKVENKDDLYKLLKLYEKYKEKESLLANYVSLMLSVDLTDEDAKILNSKFNMEYPKMAQANSIVSDILISLDEKIIEDYKKNYKELHSFIEKILRKKPHILDKDKELLLSKFSYTLDSPIRIYDTSKMEDMTFEDFEVDGKVYKNSFVLYENYYQYHRDTEVRRKAFQSFSRGLEKYKNTFAAIYDNYLNIEKTQASLRGFDSLIDYHLFSQDVTREMYNRQIDLIMKYLAPHMRHYARLIKKFYNLDQIRFSDLKLPIDADYNKKINIEDSKKYVEKVLSVMGEDYLKIAMSSYKDRWTDFASNIGKSTGGFCASPYKRGSYILLSWTGEFSELFTLVHEIGHGCHFHYAQEENSVLEEEPSLYFIEAPSTCNEVLLVKGLLKDEKDKRFIRYILSYLIGNTYFHNFVTHLLEAAYQREVYYLVDKGQPITENILSKIKLDVLKKFWGDEVIMDEGAELTWMRQPHYFMGLYSYTYSAGLTISTNIANRIYEEGQSAVNDWKKALKSGGRKTPVELAKLGGIDITKDQPLMNTIDYIGSIIDKIDSLID